MSTVTPPRPSLPRQAGPTRPSPAGSGLATSIDPVRVVRRHAGWIIGAAVVGAFLGGVAYFILDRSYSLYAGEAIFEIRPGLQDSREVGTREIGSDQLATRLANTETVLLTSRDILSAAIRHPDVRRTQWYEDYVAVGEDGNQTFLLEDAVDDLVDSLSSSVIRGTNFFRLNWRTANAPDVPVVLNSIAQAYLDRRRELDQAVLVSNIDLFTRQLNETTRELDNLEMEIRAFIRERGITTLTDPRFSMASVAAERLTQEIGQVASQMNLMEGMLMQTSAKLMGTIEPTSEDVHEAQRDPLVSPHLSNVTHTKTQLRAMLDRTNPRHPTVLELEAQLRAAEIELEVTMQEVMRRNLEAQHRRLQSQLENLREHYEKLQAEAEAKDAAMRDLAADQAQYQAMESRRLRLESQREADMMMIKEIQMIRLRDDSARVRLAQQAQLPREKAFPRREIVIPLGTLLVMALTVGVIFLRELTDQRIKSASDLSVLPSAKVLGVIPELEEDPTNSAAAELVVCKHPRSVLAESYRQASTSILRAADRSGHQTVLFLGGLPGAGTSTAVTNIAASLAATGKSVLVVDANFRRPRLAQAMGLAADGVGLGDLLVGEATIDDAVIESPQGIHVISAGTPGNRVFERLNNGLFDNIIAELRSRFDMILFDAPPAVVAGDAMVLANRVDAAVLVIRAHQEQRGLVARVINQLSDARCEGLGILLNRPRRAAGGYFKKNFEAMAAYSAKSST